MALFLWSFGLIGYYSSKRPREPMLERGWTSHCVGLTDIMELMQRMSGYSDYLIGNFPSSSWGRLAQRYDSFTKKTSRGERSESHAHR